MARILILCEYPTLNGGERSMLSILPRVAERHHVQVAAPPVGDLADALQRQGVEHVPLSIVDATGDRYEQPRARDEIRKAILTAQPDLVHANSLSMARLLGPVAAAERLPSIGHLRDIIGLSRKAIDDLNQNTRLIAVSQATREFHVRAGLDSDRTHVVHNGVDLAAFGGVPTSESIRASLGLDNSSRLVLTVGQLIARKGTDLLVDAAIDIAGRRPHVHFLIVGECYSRKDESIRFVEELRERVSQSSARNNIHFVGERDDVPSLLNQADVVAQPSRQDPLCRVLLEAAAASRAIVTTDVGGTREIFPLETDAAVVIQSNSAPALSAAIESLLDDDRRRSDLGARARRRIETEFSVERASGALLRHYDEVLG
ncbi:MAG: glycosyltransferase family 4 protein [Pirellulales bacterium]|nr:glycosyltransferase family 4 protein [Pirellulales bacterium]